MSLSFLCLLFPCINSPYNLPILYCIWLKVLGSFVKNCHQMVISKSAHKLLRPIFLKIQWGLSTILRTSNKSVWSNIFWYVKVCKFWKCIQCTIHWNKTQILKKEIPSDKINGTKNVLFFLSQAPTHDSFTFNLWFLF